MNRIQTHVSQVGGDLLDLPGLSYVTHAAESSLRAVTVAMQFVGLDNIRTLSECRMFFEKVAMSSWTCLTELQADPTGSQMTALRTIISQIMCNSLCSYLVFLIG